MTAEAVKIARQKTITRMEVGTGNFGLDKLANDEKAGFRIVRATRSFVVGNHEKEIIENEIRCVDVVRPAMRSEQVGPALPFSQT